MCITIVPVVRGEMLIGGIWHREQLVIKTCSPVSGGRTGVLWGAGVGCAPADGGCCAEPAAIAQAVKSRPLAIGKIRKFIDFSMDRLES